MRVITSLRIPCYQDGIETEMTQGTFSNPKFVENVSKRIPVRRWGMPEDFAAIAILHHEHGQQLSYCGDFSGGWRIFHVLTRESGPELECCSLGILRE